MIALVMRDEPAEGNPSRVRFVIVWLMSEAFTNFMGGKLMV